MSTQSIVVFSAIVAISASGAVAQEMPKARSSQIAESFDTVNKEFVEAVVARVSERSDAQAQAEKNGKGKDFKLDKPFPGLFYSPRFLAIAEKDPDGPDAIDALRMTLNTSISDGVVLETRARALKLLRDYYVAKPAIKRLLATLIKNDDEDFKALVSEVVARNPDRKVQAAVCKEKIIVRENEARFAEVANDPKRLATIVRLQGQDVVKGRLVRAQQAKIEIERLKHTLRTQYGDLYLDLSPGNPAPEVKIQAVDGKDARLSALKGKVVVLDIWATWCGPCKAMIPHEREMVERLKDKPFALVSISADEKLETLINFLGKEKMPWTHWWNGMQGGIIEDWDVRRFPTIYVLDPQGVIRYKDVRGDELEKAVNALLTEATAQPAPATK